MIYHVAYTLNTLNYIQRIYLVILTYHHRDIRVIFTCLMKLDLSAQRPKGSKMISTGTSNDIS